MPLLPRNHHRSGRAPFTMLLIVLSLLAIPLILIGAAPQWWTEGHVYHMEGSSVATSSDYSPANLGQLKHFAVTAYDYLHDATTEYGDPTAPVPASPNPAEQTGGIGWRLRASIGQFVEFNDAVGGDSFAIKRDTAQNIVKRTSSTTADYAMLNQGQLKAIASLFYERLDGIYAPYPVPRPWGSDNGPANDFAPATLGQLKNTFSFDLSKDSDGDGVSDLVELHRLGTGGTSDPTNPFNSDSDHDGIADNDDTAPNDPDRDGDGFLDGEDKWPNDPRRGDFIPPKFYAVTDLSPTLPATDPYYYSVPGGITINADHQVSWVLASGADSTWTSEEPGDGTYIHESQGPWCKVLTWKDGILTGSNEIGDTARYEKRHLGTTHFAYDTTIRTHGIVGVTGSGIPFGNFTSYYEYDTTVFPPPPGSSIFDYTTNSEPYDWFIQKRLYGDSDDGGYERSVTIHSLSDPKPSVPGVAVGLEWSVINQATNEDPNPTGQEKQIIKVFRRTIDDSGNQSPMEYFSPQGEIYEYYSPAPVTLIAVHKVPVISKASANGNVLIGFNYGPYLDDDGNEKTDPPLKNKLWLASDGSTKIIPGEGIAVNNAGQVIGVTDTSETALNTGAFFAWVDAFGAVKNMKLEELLIWTDKPAGVKDDYDRYFNRIAKNGTPIESQLRKIRPLFVSDAELAAQYGSFNGKNFPGGAPEHIMAKAEMASEKLISGTMQRTWLPVELMFSLAPGLKNRDSATATEWHYLLQVIEMPPGVTFTPKGMNLSGSISGSGTLVELSDPHPELKPTHILLATPDALLVDKNHNGLLANANDNPVENSFDTPTPNDPFVFWLNDDHDIGHTVDDTDWEEDDVAGDADNANNSIDWERDLEDFARIRVSLTDAIELLSQKVDIKLVLKAQRVKKADGSSAPPAIIRVFQATVKGTGYLLDPATSFAQIGGADAREMPQKTKYAYAIGAPPTLATGDDVEPGTGYVGNFGGRITLPKLGRDLLFEGSVSGESDLYFELRKKSDDTLISRSGTTRIHIKPVDEMFEQWSIGDAQVPNEILPEPIGAASRYSKSGGTPFEYPIAKSASEHQYILFVHGWNMSPSAKDQFIATAFKRLYWTGYQGRFGGFRWPTDYTATESATELLWNHSNFDRSEHNAWKSALPLARLLGTLDRRYSNPAIVKSGVYIVAHSMGNVVAGEALRIGALDKRFLIRSYVASQAAIPAQTYQAAYPPDIAPAKAPIPGSLLDIETANVYKNWFAPNGGSVLRRVNFYNPNDFALWHDSWEVNQGFKPNRVDWPLQKHLYSFDGETEGPLNDISFKRKSGSIVLGVTELLKLVTNLDHRYIVMAFAGQSRSAALGRVDGPAGNRILNGAVNLQSLWPDGDGPHEPRSYGSHKWHSAQFRSTHVRQYKYWQTLVSDDGFKLISAEDLRKIQP